MIRKVHKLFEYVYDLSNEMKISILSIKLIELSKISIKFVTTSLINIHNLFDCCTNNCLNLSHLNKVITKF